MQALLGEKAAALRANRKASELVSGHGDIKQDQWQRFNLTMIHALTGDKAKAVAEVLRVPLAQPINNTNPISVHTLRVDPAFANLRGDPQFEARLNDPQNNAPLF